MNILSLFDGMSCGYEALTRAGIKIDNYFASEIDKYAIQISKKNHPDIIHIGNVQKVYYGGRTENTQHLHYEHPNTLSFERYSTPIEIDLLIGGSPCQDLSIAKKDGKGLAGEKSSLFFEYVRLLNETKPNYFLLENVASMKKADRDEITRILGVEPVVINSSLVSAQNRKRLYWVGKWNGTKYETVDIPQPEDKGIMVKDILEDENFEGLYSDYNNSTTFDKSRTLGAGCGITRSSTFQQVITSPVRILKIGKGGQGDRVYLIEGKSVNLSAQGGGRGEKTGLYEVKDFVRKLTPIECERLQTLPDNYTEGVSNSQRYKMIGNGWTVDVIAHILSFIK